MRAAAANHALSLKQPVEKIMQLAGWNKCSTFQKFYERAVHENSMLYAARAVWVPGLNKYW